ncbi:MAG: hypothetical protein Q9164_001634 [Protoblastenia rupestris]
MSLRRLAADHAALQRTDLPPHWLFPPSSIESSMPDDLTQLTIFLTGPQGTPYSQGLWRLFLKIPEDYPKSPPKAYFRTKIWHPNVEENTGSVCVDTLKKDWESKLTLRDVLITISCLLIQPNPDSALNSTAGHLLQDDYESFSRHAKLMTSIHASIPPDLREIASAARGRGEIAETSRQDNAEPRSQGMSASPSVLALRSLPQRRTSTHPAPVLIRFPQDAHDSDEEEDENSASKENNPALSPIPVPEPSPRKPKLAKRPLSNLPCPIEPDEDQHTTFTNPSEQNIAKNAIQIPTAGSRPKGIHLVEKSSMLNLKGRSSQDRSFEQRTASAPEAFELHDGRPVKRICSDEAKENAAAESSIMGQPRAPQSSSVPVKLHSAGPRKASAPGAIGSSRAGKPRVGLRRL